MSEIDRGRRAMMAWLGWVALLCGWPRAARPRPGVEPPAGGGGRGPSCRPEAALRASGNEFPCMPQVDADFLGIRISAPREVFFRPGTQDPIWGGFARVMVAGVCVLPYLTLGLRGEWNEFILLVATDTRNKRAFGGMIREPVNPLINVSPAHRTDPLEGTGERPEDFARTVAGREFLSNIARDMGLPECEAEYDVYATLGPYRSNVVQIKVSRRK